MREGIGKREPSLWESVGEYHCCLDSILGSAFYVEREKHERIGKRLSVLIPDFVHNYNLTKCLFRETRIKARQNETDKNASFKRKRRKAPSTSSKLSG